MFGGVNVDKLKVVSEKVWQFYRSSHKSNNYGSSKNDLPNLPHTKHSCYMVCVRMSLIFGENFLKYLEKYCIQLDNMRACS